MSRIKGSWISIIAAILLLTGCSETREAGSRKGNPEPVISESPVQQAAASPSAALIAANPYDVNHFLTENDIANGDIYLEDNVVHINIVGLDTEVEDAFAGKFTAASYVLHNVSFTASELESAYKLLQDKDLLRQLNLYGAWIDVKENNIGITVPDDYLAAARQALEQQIDPAMLAYDVRGIEEPHVTGTIVQSESDPMKQILILEPGKTEPTYWFSMNERSELYNSDGDRIEWAGLKPGQQVHIWSTGLVLDSLPAQATIRRLELIKE